MARGGWEHLQTVGERRVVKQNDEENMGAYCIYTVVNQYCCGILALIVP